MPYELSVCLRYLRPRRSRAYISTNTLISILGLAVGVMTLIVVIAVMTGFATNLQERSIGLSSHIEIAATRLVEDWREVEQKIKNTPHVAAVSPFVWGDLSLKIGNRSTPIFFRGVDPEKIGKVSMLPKYLVYFTCGRCKTTYTREEYEKNVKNGIFRCSHRGCGFIGEDDHLLKSRLDLEEVEVLDEYDEKKLFMPLILGKLLCDNFDLKLGDTLYIASAGIGALGEIKRVFPARITGIFRSGLAEADVQWGFTSLRSGQILQQFADKDLVHGFSVKLDDIEYCGQVKEALTEKLGYPYIVKTWMDLRISLFRAIQQEKVIMFIIVTLITAVAALNIISSLTMTVVHKRKEIGILRSMGAKRRSITAIFALSGIIIGMLGIILGLLGGLVLSHNIDPVADWVSKITGTTKLFSGDIFYLDRIPVDLSVRDMGVICGVAFVLSILASIYPAWKAAGLDPVEVLRYE
ncbi:MAG: ABC transporter permease [bacterium]|nr:ABC transporter permease [bacterium]